LSCWFLLRINLTLLLNQKNWSTRWMWSQRKKFVSVYWSRWMLHWLKHILFTKGTSTFLTSENINHLKILYQIGEIWLQKTNRCFEVKYIFKMIKPFKNYIINYIFKGPIYNYYVFENFKAMFKILQRNGEMAISFLETYL
jgi:hypothetical protein